MDEVEAPGQRTQSEQEERAQEEHRVLKKIRSRSAAVASEWQPPDIHPVERLSRGFVPGFPEAYELDVHAFIDEDFGRPTRSIIRGVIREEQDGGSSSTQAGACRETVVLRGTICRIVLGDCEHGGYELPSMLLAIDSCRVKLRRSASWAFCCRL